MAIRKPAVAGQFYESDPVKLRKEVMSYLGKPGAAVKGRVVGVLAPHAGYTFSGATAGAALAFLKDISFDTAVIIGTGHTEAVNGAALIAEGSFETPLGRVEIDAELAKALLSSSKLIENRPSAHVREHSVEVELPFLQALGRPFRFVPIVANTDDVAKLTEIGRAIGAQLKGRKAVIVVSSDLSHYPPGALAEKSDLSLLKAFGTAVRNNDLEYFGLANELLLEKCRGEMDTAACGFSAMVIGAAACLEAGADDFKLVEYTHSGRISGNDENVVGYGAGVFFSGGGREPDALSNSARKELLSLARSVIGARLKKKRLPPPPLNGDPALNQPAAVFVTLTMNGSLRGCIGTMEPRQLLTDAVAALAPSSAFKDPRFPPLSEAELAEVKIELSVLSPLRRVESWREVKQGVHGVYIAKGNRTGTYLPQVWEHFSSREGFLSSLCEEKAGLPADAWQDKSLEIYVYNVECFQEE